MTEFLLGLILGVLIVGCFWILHAMDLYEKIDDMNDAYRQQRMDLYAEIDRLKKNW